MQAVTGVFLSQADAERAIETLRSTGVPNEKITLLTPGGVPNDPDPMEAGDQSGMGKATRAGMAAVTGLSGKSLLLAAVVPGVGPVTAAGLLGAAILAAAGAGVGTAARETVENLRTEGLPEDEIFVYEHALRKGRAVVIVLVDDAGAAALRERLRAQGAEELDAARHQWWVGLRNTEQEHYSSSGRNFGTDEKFYRLGFEAALHARMRCKEFDQVSAEMTSSLEDLQRQYPGVDLEEAYTRGYQRGREYYQHLCDKSNAA